MRLVRWINVFSFQCFSCIRLRRAETTQKMDHRNPSVRNSTKILVYMYNAYIYLLQEKTSDVGACRPFSQIPAQHSTSKMRERERHTLAQNEDTNNSKQTTGLVENIKSTPENVSPKSRSLPFKFPEILVSTFDLSPCLWYIWPPRRDPGDAFASGIATVVKEVQSRCCLTLCIQQWRLGWDSWA